MKKNNIKTLFAIAATIAIIIVIMLLIGVIVTAISHNNEYDEIFIILLVVFGVISLFIYGANMVLFFIERLQRTNIIINNMNAINSSQEEVFEVGIISFDEEQNITFVTPWLQREGFESFLGKKTSKMEIDLETTKKQKWKKDGRIWEVTTSRKNMSILLKDITYLESLNSFIISRQKAVLSIHTSFSKKINFNDTLKTELNLKVRQSTQEWTRKVSGIFNSSASNEGTSSVIFNWINGKKYIYSEDVLNIIKKNLSKNLKDITISIGVAFGGEEYIELQEKSLKSLEISKNRGGDQIVIEKPDGDIKYIGTSSQQSVLNNIILDVKRFSLTLITDIEKAREVFITTHKFADLDALGASLGLWQLASNKNDNVYIILETMDKTAQKLFNSLPKIKENIFITVKSAKKIISNRTHIIITDASTPSTTQAFELIDNITPDRISVVDHHRLAKNSYDFDESRILIDTAISSSSEIVVEMLKQYFGQESQSKIYKWVSTSLLSGIKLDSKNLTKNVSNLTFEAVSFLINNDADIQEVEVLFQSSQNFLKIEAEAIRNISKPSKGIIFTYIDEEQIVDEETTSILADKLLQYEGVEATFVLARVDSKKYKLSARSNDKINVQDITESLGGGGHFTMAAAVWSANIKFSTVQKRIVAEINKIKKTK